MDKKAALGAVTSLWPLVAAAALAVLAACNDDNDTVAAPPPPPAQPVALTCDDTIKTGFKPDSNTSVVLVKAFKKGDALLVSGTPNARTGIAANDLCMVKLNVGPGNAGPAGAVSTSPGIGLEIWLPTAANWNKRIHALGGGGWAGGNEGSATTVNNSSGLVAPAMVAGTEGAVAVTTDTGHADTAHGGAFAMLPDGTINTALWTDFSARSLHELAVKTKALALAYYGTAPLHAYFDGFSTGGRQAMKLAQAYPDDFDGLVAGSPAFNWTRFIAGELYPQLVFQRDLGGTALTPAQQDLVSNAAISACDSAGGQHLGYILNPATCRYDPAADATVICPASGGTSTSPNCVTPTQATAINKIWYGITADGSVPQPSADNGWNATLSGSQRWYGMARGTSLYMANGAAIGLNGQASPNGPFPISSDMVALELQDPTIAGPGFVNATGNGLSGWKGLSYAQMSNAFDRGVALQGVFADINTDKPDLSAFKARGGKLLHYHGLADELIMPQGSINYHDRVLAQMGGADAVQGFYRLFLVPGMSHLVHIGFPNGTANPNANPPTPTAQQMYDTMVAWVEKGTAPDTIVVNSASAVPVAKSMTLCVYPKMPAYVSGDPLQAASYACR